MQKLMLLSSSWVKKLEIGRVVKNLVEPLRGSFLEVSGTFYRQRATAAGEAFANTQREARAAKSALWRGTDGQGGNLPRYRLQFLPWSQHANADYSDLEKDYAEGTNST